ncbi:MAG: EamA family transporter [Chloroflexia bacterium]
MEPEAHFAIAEADEDEHRPQKDAKEKGALKMDAAWWSTFALLMIAMCLTVTGELLLKTGMNKHGELNITFSTLVPTAVKLFTSPWVVGGFVFVFSGALFWLAVLSRWPLSLAYPLLSISYIIGIIASVILLGEKVNMIQVGGVFVIIFGVFLISRSS